MVKSKKVVKQKLRDVKNNRRANGLLRVACPAKPE